jgi:hypothetical protein
MAEAAYDSEPQGEAKALAQGLGQTLAARYAELKGERQMIELEWLRDLRQYQGVYDPEVLAKIPEGGSQAYIGLTRPKVLGFTARMLDMLFPGGGDRNWSLSETPEPELPPALVEGMAREVAMERYQQVLAVIEQTPEAALDAMERAGEIPPAEEMREAQMTGEPPASLVPGDEELRELVQAEAKRRAEAMASEIDDQLTETRYIEHVADCVLSGALYGSGWLKGPTTDRRLVTAWRPSEDGEDWQLQRVERFRPSVQFVPVWDVYPDPIDARAVDQLEGIYQRYLMRRADLRDLARQPGFDAKAIAEYLLEHPEGDTASHEHWETELRMIRAEDQGTIPATRQKRYEVVEYTGYADGQMLEDCGCHLAPPDAPEEAREQARSLEWRANVWCLGGRVIKATLMPFDDDTVDTYHLFTPERTEGHLFGTSLPSKMRDPDKIYQGALRALVDNIGVIAGPMLDVNVDLLTPAQLHQGVQVGARQVVYRTGRGNQAQYPALRELEFDAHIDDLLQVMEMARQQADDATAQPSYYATGSDQAEGAAETASGLSMLMGAANIVTKDSVRNFDLGVTKPLIEGYYQWNMQFSERDDVRGDFVIEATGSTALVAKEIRARSLDELSQTTLNPADEPWVKRREMLEERLRARDLDPDRFLRTEEEVQQMMERQMRAAGAEQAA